MKINKVTASFGKLENESLSFHEGLNIINAPNESGKSTWCAFIRSMLYGIDSAERQKNGYMPDKLRYAPWSGAPMEGVMELTADNCDITLTRRTKAKSAPMRDFSATYTGTNVKVEGINGENAGEMLTGVSKDMFCRSAFMAQGAVAVSGSPELERRISAIVSTGDEDTSYSEADARLRAWQRKRRYNRKGMLPELEEKIYEDERKLSDMNTAGDEIEMLEAELENSRRRCDELETASMESRSRQRKQTLEKIRNASAETARSSEAHDAAMAELADKREELGRISGNRRVSELEAEVQADTDEYERCGAAADGKRVVSVLPGAIALVLAVVFATVFMSKHVVMLAVAAAVMAAIGVFLIIKYLNARHAIHDVLTAQEKILKKYRASDIDEVKDALLPVYAALDAVKAADEKERRTRAEYENAREQQKELEAQAVQELDFSGGSSAAAKLGQELILERRKVSELSDKIANLKGRLGAIGDPLVIASELTIMEEERETIEAEYSAITLAIDTLREADSEIQSRFSPALGKTAAEYMNFLTGGRYEDVFLNRDFSAQTRADGDSVAHEAAYLSAGTLDLMYLSIRLAVCELAMSKEEPCPLIIDDALVNLDEERYQRAIELLKKISRERQVILFSCR